MWFDCQKGQTQTRLRKLADRSSMTHFLLGQFPSRDDCSLCTTRYELIIQVQLLGDISRIRIRITLELCDFGLRFGGFRAKEGERSGQSWTLRR